MAAACKIPRLCSWEKPSAPAGKGEVWVPYFQARKRQFMKILTKFSTLQRGRASPQTSYLLRPELTHPECCCEDRLGGLSPPRRVPLPHSSTRHPKIVMSTEIVTLFLK